MITARKSVHARRPCTNQCALALVTPYPTTHSFTRRAGMSGTAPPPAAPPAPATNVLTSLFAGAAQKQQQQQAAAAHPPATQASTASYGPPAGQAGQQAQAQGAAPQHAHHHAHPAAAASLRAAGQHQVRAMFDVSELGCTLDLLLLVCVMLLLVYGMLRRKRGTCGLGMS